MHRDPGSDSYGMFYEMTNPNIQGTFKSYFAGTSALYTAHCIAPSFDDTLTLRPASNGEAFDDVNITVVPLSPDCLRLRIRRSSTSWCGVESGLAAQPGDTLSCLSIQLIASGAASYRIEAPYGNLRVQSYFVTTTATNYFGFCQAIATGSNCK